MIELISENLVFIAVVTVLVWLMLYGHRKGFMSMLVSMLSVAASFAASVFFTPPVSDALWQNDVANSFFSMWADRLMALAAENKVSQLLRLVDINIHAADAGKAASLFLTRAVTFIAIFIICRVLLKILSGLMNAVNRIPVLGGLNQIAGAALGLGEALAYVWIFMIVINLLPQEGPVLELGRSIEGNGFLNYLQEHNIIASYLSGLIRGF